jgi:hypothetical protein
MTLPKPQKSTSTHFYKYSNADHLDWLQDILLKHEIYLPTLSQLNDDNDGLPHLKIQTENELIEFLIDKFVVGHPEMTPQQLREEESKIRFNVNKFGSAMLHPQVVKVLDERLKGFRVYSMAKRFDMGNLWALYADRHQGYCLEFANVGLFGNAKDVNYRDSKEMAILAADPSLEDGDFFFCKTLEWKCEDEVRLWFPRNFGDRARFKPEWLTRIILGRAMSEENKTKIRAWAKERNPQLTVATTKYDATKRAIVLNEG